MMNIPGNFIRGAGSVVGGTMSAVVSVAGGRRGSTDMSGEIVVKEKSVLTIKVTPPLLCYHPILLYFSNNLFLLMKLGNTSQGCTNNKWPFHFNWIFNKKK
jgi:hypothetical protein